MPRSRLPDGSSVFARLRTGQVYISRAPECLPRYRLTSPGLPSQPRPRSWPGASTGAAPTHSSHAITGLRGDPRMVKGCGRNHNEVAPATAGCGPGRNSPDDPEWRTSSLQTRSAPLALSSSGPNPHLHRRRCTPRPPEDSECLPSGWVCGTAFHPAGRPNLERESTGDRRSGPRSPSDARR